MDLGIDKQSPETKKRKIINKYSYNENQLANVMKTNRLMDFMFMFTVEEFFKFFDIKISKFHLILEGGCHHCV